jgi:alpha-tubulin suppressor-like RCC1 family protein
MALNMQSTHPLSSSFLRTSFLRTDFGSKPLNQITNSHTHGLGECDRPVWLMNAVAIAAGEYQSVAATDSGTVMQWGDARAV